MNGQAIVKHSLVVSGHRTSVSIESPFWSQVQAIAAQRDISIAALVAEIDSRRNGLNLSSAIRVFVLEQVLAAQAER